MVAVAAKPIHVLVYENEGPIVPDSPKTYVVHSQEGLRAALQGSRCSVGVMQVDNLSAGLIKVIESIARVLLRKKLFVGRLIVNVSSFRASSLNRLMVSLFVDHIEFRASARSSGRLSSLVKEKMSSRGNGRFYRFSLPVVHVTRKFFKGPPTYALHTTNLSEFTKHARSATNLVLSGINVSTLFSPKYDEHLSAAVDIFWEAFRSAGSVRFHECLFDAKSVDVIFTQFLKGQTGKISFSDVEDVEAEVKRRAESQDGVVCIPKIDGVALVRWTPLLISEMLA